MDAMRALAKREERKEEARTQANKILPSPNVTPLKHDHDRYTKPP